MDVNDFSHLKITDVHFFSMVKEDARRINLVDTINHMVDRKIKLLLDIVVLAKVLDTLSGRYPLYRKIYFVTIQHNF